MSRSIDAMLRRPLRVGNEFTSLMPISSCKRTFFGNGDTHYSMDKIKDSILGYYPTVKKLAKELKQPSLKQTIATIYDFLYNHIQYKADSEDQLLRSPACSWFDRKKGIDCKSYTIFAGCLLSSLGYKYYIRKVRQQGDKKNMFSHVYIVVPKNQITGKLTRGYYIIDPTLHSNKEVSFLQKKDVYMTDLPHYGLKGATSIYLNKIEENPTFVPKGPPIFRKPETRELCADFFSYLRSRGVNPKVVNAAENHVNKCFDRNIDPTFHMTPTEIRIQGSCYPLVPTPGLGDPISIGALGSQIFGEVKLISGIIGLYDKTIGAVLGNGWRLGCWNTSNSPAQTEEEVPIDFQYYLKESKIREGITTQSWNQFAKWCQAYIIHREYGRRNGKLAKCTRDGNQVGYQMMKAFYMDAVAKATRILKENGGDLIKDGTEIIFNWRIPAPSGYYNGTMTKTPGEVDTLSYDKFKVIAPKPVIFDDDGTDGGSDTGDTGTGTGNTGTGNTGTGTGNTGTGTTNPKYPNIDPKTGMPYGYNQWADVEKWLYGEWKKRGKDMKFFNTFVMNSPSIRFFSQNLYKALGITPPNGSGSSIVYMPHNRGNTQPYLATTDNMKKAGFGMTGGLIVLGLALGTWYLTKKKK